MKLVADICFWLGVALTMLIVWAVIIEESVAGLYAGGLLLAPIPFTFGWLIHRFIVGPRE